MVARITTPHSIQRALNYNEQKIKKGQAELLHAALLKDVEQLINPLNILLNTIVIYIRGFCTKAGIKELDHHIKTFAPFGKAKNVKEKTAQNYRL